MLVLTEIPRSHPRYASLVARERVAKGVKDGITSTQGLIAQGRGEAFDYLLGEKTTTPAAEATRAAAAVLLLARQPALSVNGNVAALAAEEIVELSKAIGAPLEVNLFHRSEERVKRSPTFLEAWEQKASWERSPTPRSLAWITPGLWPLVVEFAMPMSPSYP